MVEVAKKNKRFVLVFEKRGGARIIGQVVIQRAKTLNVVDFLKRLVKRARLGINKL